MARQSRKKWSVFISHRSTDLWVAKQIAAQIAACGAVPFLDEAEIDVGADFEEHILNFLETADELLVLLTPWAMERPYVWAENGRGVGSSDSDRRPTTRRRSGRFAVRPAVPIFLKRRDLLNLNEIDGYLDQVRHKAGRRAPSRRRKE